MTLVPSGFTLRSISRTPGAGLVSGVPRCIQSSIRRKPVTIALGPFFVTCASCRCQNGARCSQAELGHHSTRVAKTWGPARGLTGWGLEFGGFGSLPLFGYLVIFLANARVTLTISNGFHVSAILPY